MPVITRSQSLSTRFGDARNYTRYSKVSFSMPKKRESKHTGTMKTRSQTKRYTILLSDDHGMMTRSKSRFIKEFTK